MVGAEDTCGLDLDVQIQRLPREPPDQPSSALTAAWSRCSMCTSARKASGRDEEMEGQVPIKLISLEGPFERRGLRAWDVMWNSSFAELNGRELTIHDVFEDERTLLAHVVLSEHLEVHRISPTEWCLEPPSDLSPHCRELQFTWQARDEFCADRWVEALRNACQPDAPLAAGENSEGKDQDGEKDEAVGLLAPDPMLLSALLSPGLLGLVALDPKAFKVMVYMWSHIAEILSGAAAIMPDTDERREAKLSLEQSGRPFRAAKTYFEACLLGDDDVELHKYLEAISAFAGVLALMGSWTAPLAREGYKNGDMINSRIDQAPASCRAMLQKEVDEEIHGPGGMLSEPSGATGILWTYRGLSLWLELWRRAAIPSMWEGAPPTDLLKASFNHAYCKTTKRYHGNLMETGVSVATMLIPSWERVWPNFAASPAELEQDVREWCEVMDILMSRFEAMISEFDMDDVRKTY